MTQAMYADTKAVLEEVNRLPDEARRAILTMLRGAIVISDMYQTDSVKQPTDPVARDSA